MKETVFDLDCVIFAGGKSSRMGEDKSLLPFGGFDTLAEFQLSKFSKIFKNVYISCKDSSKFDFDADFILDVDSKSTYAPTAGFVAMFEKLKGERFFVISVDAPFVGKDEIQALLEADEAEHDATIAKTAFGMQPMCGIYHRSLEKEFIYMFENDSHKLGKLLKTKKTTFKTFDNEEAFLNLNHPHEYQQALSLS